MPFYPSKNNNWLFISSSDKQVKSEWLIMKMIRMAFNAFMMMIIIIVIYKMT